ncbi:MAG: hypothetical protein MI976_25250 [Pseudomonadales bacterium]|nr:hypothetical protein [Pseudomonadales bacterium]
MIRSALLVFVVSTVLLSSMERHASIESRTQSGHPSMAASFHISDNIKVTDDIKVTSKKERQIKKKASEVLKPLIEFKNAVEPHLPQKELRTLKRIAFRVFLIARRYL